MANAYASMLTSGIAEEEQKKLQAELQNQTAARAASGVLATGGYKSPYAEKLDALTGELENMKFSYRAQEDPNYQAMRRQYLLEADRTASDVLAKASAATGGRASTFAINAASQAANYYKAQLSAQQQTLFDAAYERYKNQYNQKLQERAYAQEQENVDYTRWLNQQKADAEAKENAYDRLVTVIATAGYTPTAEELTAAGMTENEAAAWRSYYQRQLELANAGGSSGGGGGGGGGYYSGGGEEMGGGPEAEDPVYSNGQNNENEKRFTEAELAQIAMDYMNSQKGTVYYDSRTVDNWLTSKGYTSQVGKVIKSYLKEYGAVSMYGKQSTVAATSGQKSTGSKTTTSKSAVDAMWNRGSQQSGPSKTTTSKKGTSGTSKSAVDAMWNRGSRQSGTKTAAKTSTSTSGTKSTSSSLSSRAQSYLKVLQASKSRGQTTTQLRKNLQNSVKTGTITRNEAAAIAKKLGFTY